MTEWSARLRTELCLRAARYAARHALASYESKGRDPVTLFPPAADGRSHGNFHPESFAAIAADDAWKRRLKKSHSQRERSLPPPYNMTACELDSCTSSDALLMNLLCYPRAISGHVAELLEVAPGAKPRFGVPGAVPLRDGALDATELDMRIGETTVEAKLTESDFTARPFAHVERYADLYAVFERDALPRTESEYRGYQLIRNVLAIAREPNRRFFVFLDARRPDLLREWWTVHVAIRDVGIRRRCGFVQWQELAAAAPAPLREYLAEKYGL